MPAFRSKLSQEQILGLAIFLRAFAVTPLVESHPAPVAGQPPGEVPPKGKGSKAKEVSPANPRENPPPTKEAQTSVVVRKVPRPIPPAETPAHAQPPPILRLPGVQVFRDTCMACHGADGRGTPVHAAMPTIPDFTNSKWQHSRTDVELQHSILEGKGKFMLPMKNRVDATGAKDLVAYVRNFTAGKQVVPVEQPPQPQQITERPTSPKVSETVPKKENPLLAAKEPVPPPTPKKELPVVQGPEIIAQPSPRETAEQIRFTAAAYRQNCLTCHGADGRGTAMRPSMPTIPDFTNSVWQRNHNSGLLTASIQSGKGVFMPAFGQRLKPNEIRNLLAYVRAFGPPAPAPIRPEATDYERQFHELQRQWNELDRQFKELSHEPGKP